MTSFFSRGMIVLAAHRMAGVLLAGVLAMNACPATAQQYPYRPIRIIASNPGAQIDTTARLIAPALTARLGQQVIVDNRPGIIAIETAVQASPDAYSLLMYTGAVWVLPILRKVSFEPSRDLAPITLAARAPLFLFAHPALPAASVKEVIALAKAKPGVLNYGSAGFGTTNHLAFELFKSMSGADIVRIPYKGSSAAAIGLITNQVQLMFVSALVGMAHVRAGRLKVIAAGTLEPSALAPEVPTLSASGLPGYEAASMGCVWAPKGTPKALIDRLHQEIIAVLRQPEIKGKLLASGIETVGMTPEQTAAYIRSDAAKWRKLIQAIGIRRD